MVILDGSEDSIHEWLLHNASRPSRCHTPDVHLAVFLFLATSCNSPSRPGPLQKTNNIVKSSRYSSFSDSLAYSTMPQEESSLRRLAFLFCFATTIVVMHHQLNLELKMATVNQDKDALTRRLEDMESTLHQKETLVEALQQKAQQQERTWKNYFQSQFS